MASPTAIIPQVIAPVKERYVPVYSFTEIRGLLSPDELKRACDEMLEIYHQAHNRENVSNEELAQKGFAVYLLSPHSPQPPHEDSPQSSASASISASPLTNHVQDLDGLTTSLNNLFECLGCHLPFPPAKIKGNLCESCSILTPDILSPNRLKPSTFPPFYQSSISARLKSCKDCSEPIELGIICQSCEEKLLIAIEASSIPSQRASENFSPYRALPTRSSAPTIANLLAEGCQVLWQVQTKFTNLPKSIYHEITSLMQHRSIMPMSTKSTFFHNASTGTLTAYCQELDAKAIELTLNMMGLNANLTPFTLQAKVA